MQFNRTTAPPVLRVSRRKQISGPILRGRVRQKLGIGDARENRRPRVVFESDKLLIEIIRLQRWLTGQLEGSEALIASEVLREFRLS